MTGKMKWEKRAKLERPLISSKDEREYRERDAAARWLAKFDKRRIGSFKVKAKPR